MAGFVTSCLAAAPAHAEAWVFQPSVQVGGEYDSNVILSVLPHESTWGTRLGAGLTVSRLTDTLDLVSHARVDYVDYTGSQVPNQTLAFIDLASKFKQELSDWTVDGSYQHDTTVRYNYIHFDNTDISLGLTSTNVARNRLIFNPSWTHHLTERSDVGLLYRLTYVTYDNTVNTGLYDYNQNDVGGRYSYNLTERDVLTGLLEGSKYHATSGANDYTNVAASVQLEHSFSETLHGTVLVGARKTSFDVPAGSGNTTGGLLNVSFQKQLSQIDTLTAGAGRSVLPSGDGTLSQADQVYAQFAHSVSPLISVTLQGRAYRTQTIGTPGAFGDNEHYAYVEPNVLWHLTRWWTLTGGYRFERVKRSYEPSSAQNNVAYLTLSYTWPTGVPTGQ